MLILFPEDPAERGHLDSSYELEAKACDAVGLPRALVNLESLLAHAPNQAVRRVPQKDDRAIYRGWMIPSAAYRELYQALKDIGVVLMTNPEAYARTHELPGWYPALEGSTPRSIWIPTSSPVDGAAIDGVLRSFGDSALVVKDYVKSRKHEWLDACFIRSAHDWPEAKRVIENFARRQGADLQGGLVFREFAELESVGIHPRSRMPISHELRLFFLQGELVATFRYWPEGAYLAAEPPLLEFTDLARRIESPFFTMDIARRKDGTWTVMELGDGQVSGLPRDEDAPELYRALARGF